MDTNKLLPQEKEALIDLLWMNQMRDVENETFVMQNSRVEWHFGTQCRDTYNLNSHTGNKIKFLKLAKSNLLLRTILEEGLLREWVARRANFTLKYGKTEPKRVYDIFKNEQKTSNYNEFFHTRNSFMHNNKWSEIYQKVLNEITNQQTGEF